MKGIVCTIVLLSGLMLTMMSTATLGVVAKKRNAKSGKRVQATQIPQNLMLMPVES